jgi:tripartite-type tricarboxylate transporter receptor subunit TctC
MKKAFVLILAALAALVFSPAALAQSFPSKQIRWLVPYPAGGGSDFMARTLATQMAADMGQPIVIDNKPGANGAIAAQDMIRSGHDGYSLLNADNCHLIYNPALYKNLSYKASDLEPVTLVGTVHMMVITGPDSPFKDAKDWLAKAKANPGKYSIASAGLGSPHHMGIEMLKHQAGLFMVHIPYRGAAPALADVAGGMVDLGMSDLAAAVAFVKSGKVRVLAVASDKRLPQLPDVPTLAEAGVKGAEAAALVGMVVPAGTPADAVAKLQQGVVKAFENPAVRGRFSDFGVEPGGISTAQYAALLKKETTRWHKLIRDLKITLD